MDYTTYDDESSLQNSSSDFDSDTCDCTDNVIDFSNLSESERQAHEKIISKLLQTTKIDFTHYRKSTVQRRLLRRLGLSKITTLSEYHSYIESNPDEINLLYNDLLLAYTSFFRDPHVFQ